MQIWDFNLGQSRDTKDAYVTKDDKSFTINSFVDLMNDTCSTKPKGVKQICQVTFSFSLWVKKLFSSSE